MTWFQGSITTLGNFPLNTPKFLKGPLETFFLEQNTYCRCALISTLYLRNLTLTLPLCFCVKQHLLTLAFLLVTSQACYFLHKETIKILFQKSKKIGWALDFHLSYLFAVCLGTHNLPSLNFSFFLYKTGTLIVTTLVDYCLPRPSLPFFHNKLVLTWWCPSSYKLHFLASIVAKYGHILPNEIWVEAILITSAILA